MTSLFACLLRELAASRVLALAGLFALLLSPIDCRADNPVATPKDNALLIYAGKLSHDHWYEP